MKWINFFHWYQPPGQQRSIVEKVARESYGPMVEFLLSRPEVRVTINISGALTEQLAEYGLSSLLDGIRQLAERGQVELVGTAAYHVILPLVPDETPRQIKLHTDINSRAFGSTYKPSGFFPPEMCYSKAVEHMVHEAGFTWMILDEIAWDGHLGNVSFQHRYTSGIESMAIVFRDRVLSNFLAFTASLDVPEQFWQAVHNDGRSDAYLVTAMDGENLGHHRKGLDRFWQTLVTDHRVTTMTVSAYLQELEDEHPCTPLPSSWSTEERGMNDQVPFGLWDNPDNEIHALQWQLTRLVCEEVARAKREHDQGYEKARNLLDRALSSDQYWWASAQPWWSVEIVTDGAKRLAEVVGQLQTMAPEQRQAVSGLFASITERVRYWEDNGIVQKRQEEFLQRCTTAPYMGGKKVASR